ncbi:MAG: ABC transporter substrate-binding protein [Rickettsiaceae bacterium]|nr:ABC transporter substrate-binding protein [Rickettsiaceae bacterium]
MLKRIYFFTILLMFANNSFANSEVSAYVDHLLKKTLSILRNNELGTEEKISISQNLIEQNMDLPWMSKFVLGKYRRSLTEDQISQFTKLYSSYIVKSYANAVRFYKPEQTISIRSQSPISKDEYVVKTFLNSPNADPIRIDYVIRKFDGDKFKVFDIVTEGISLINSNQAEFGNVISNSSFEKLLEDLDNKVSSLNASNIHG